MPYKNIEDRRAYERAWHKAHPGYANQYRTVTKAQRRAHKQVWMAIDRGDLVRGECEQLDESCSGPIHGHHDDYDKPLEVRWLCCSHHKRFHREEQHDHREPLRGSAAQLH